MPAFDIAVLGVGRMGAAMARQMAVDGHRIRLWNRTTQTAQQLGEAIGARACSSPVEAVQGADVVIAMLASGPVTEAVLAAPETMQALPAHVVVCDMGTSGIDTARRLAATYGRADRSFVDAPVSGSVATIEARQLLIMASGNKVDIAKLEPVFAAFAKRVVPLGPAGNGQAMKLAVNLVLHTLNAAMSEGLSLANRLGVPAELAYDVLESSAVGAPFVQYKRTAYLDPGAPVAMSLNLSKKDLALIAEMGSRVGAHAPVATAALGLIAEACDAGIGEQDMAALYRYLGE